MTTLERCPHPHAFPAIECTGVKLTRSWRRIPVCMCGHPKAVHEHWRVGLDCGLCDCLHYETARRRAFRRYPWALYATLAALAAFWAAVWFELIHPAIQAVRGAR